MKSPFPGMDPYIESCGLWEDFHTKLIVKIFETLAQTVPERYVVRTGERSYMVLAGREGKETHSFHPDLGVVTPPPAAQPTASGGAAVVDQVVSAGAVPMQAFIEMDYREAFIEIYEADPHQQLVTCLEVLSPSNKRRRTPGWRKYQRKRQALLLGSANLVEIDLLRGGERMPMFDQWPNAPYTMLVARQERAPHCLVWPVHYQSPVPIIPVPLAPPDPDVLLNLQPLIESVYQLSHYDRSIDYACPLKPPLAADESSWLEQQLRDRIAKK
jgi:Protein of unknown function (DUF4058)